MEDQIDRIRNSIKHLKSKKTIFKIENSHILRSEYIQQSIDEVKKKIADLENILAELENIRKDQNKNEV